MNIKQFICLFCTAASCYVQLQAEQVRQPAIKVQLFKDKEGALIEVKGPYNVFDPKTGKKIDICFMPASYYMYPTTDGLKWGQEFPGVYQVLIAPDKKEATVVVAGTEYRGKSYLYQIQGAIGAVNEVSIEDFVVSVLSSHVPAEVTSQDALEAIAIVLRTEVYNCLNQGSNQFWDIKASSFNYQGYAVERRDDPFLDAIASTRGMILRNAKSEQSPAIRWFQEGKTAAPVKKIDSLANEGKDAKEILSQVCPGTIITIIK